MIVGVPREIKPQEARVGLVPSGAAVFVNHGHRVLIERRAGTMSGIPDGDYVRAGAEIVESAEAVWDEAEMIVKVKEPVPPETEWMRPGQILYTYLHLASNETLTRALLAREVSAVAYETIQLDDGTLPLLTPMSEVAGRLAVQKGAQCLEAAAGGQGILLGGVSGVRPAHVVILGAGVSGCNATYIACGMGAQVTVFDLDPAKLRYLHDIMGGRVTTVMSNQATLAEEALEADLIIGAVLIPGARAPRILTRAMVEAMKPGAAFVDIAIDQGGCSETSRPTTHEAPTYLEEGVVHYCVSNMPGAVPKTSTYALTNVTLGYGLEIAQLGLHEALQASPALQKGLNTYGGEVTLQPVADAFGMDCAAPPAG
jgi:alanine dehydrogenase